MSKPTEISCLDIVLKKAKKNYCKGTIALNENRDGASLTNVIVNGLHPEYLALKPDKCGFQIFSSGYGSKQCDYILFSEFGGKKVAVFVELKSSVPQDDAQSKAPQLNVNGRYEDYVTQLTGSSCLLDFLNSVLINFCSCTNLSNYQRYYTVLHNTDIPIIGELVPLTRPESNTSPKQAYIRKTLNDEQITLGQLIR